MSSTKSLAKRGCNCIALPGIIIIVIVIVIIIIIIIYNNSNNNHNSSSSSSNDDKTQYDAVTLNNRITIMH